MRKVILAAALPLLLAACGGGTAAEADAAQTTDDSVPSDPGDIPDGGEGASDAELGALPDIPDGGEGLSETELAALDAPKASTGKPARCHTEPLDSDLEYDGPCNFEALGGGSFVITPPQGKTFSDDATEFVIEVDAPNVAGMSMRVGGELNFLGTARRKGACWESESYQLCVYK
jgi:hypothetical protein